MWYTVLIFSKVLLTIYVQTISKITFKNYLSFKFCHLLCLLLSFKVVFPFFVVVMSVCDRRHRCLCQLSWWGHRAGRLMSCECSSFTHWVRCHVCTTHYGWWEESSLEPVFELTMLTGALSRLLFYTLSLPTLCLGIFHLCDSDLCRWPRMIFNNLQWLR